MSRITTTVALLLMATAACGQAKEDAGDGKQLDKQIMELKDYLPEIHGTIRGKYEFQTETNESRFEVRNARFSVSGNVHPIVAYKAEIDLSDEGSIKMLDAGEYRPDGPAGTVGCGKRLLCSQAAGSDYGERAGRAAP